MTTTTTYTLTVTDDDGCTNSDDVVLTLDHVVIGVDAGQDISACGPVSQTIGGTPAASNGTPPYSYTWSPASGLSSSSVANPVATTSVSVGYELVVTDAHGCSDAPKNGRKPQ